MTCIVCGEKVAFGSLLVYLDASENTSLLVYLDASENTVRPAVAHTTCFAKALAALRQDVRVFEADLANLGFVP